MYTNHCGGPCYRLPATDRFVRFLVLGSESSYYCSSSTIQEETISCIQELYTFPEGNGIDFMIQKILDCDSQGKVPKHSHILYAMACLCELSEEVRKRVFEELLIPCCRTLSHLCEFLSYLKKISWGRHTRRHLSLWFNQFSPRELAYQCTKYRNRKGFTPKDLLRLVHPYPITKDQEQVYQFCLGTWNYTSGEGEVSEYLHAVEKMLRSSDMYEVVPFILQHRFTWEHVGQQALLKQAHIWNTLIATEMPFHAFLKNLVRMLGCDTSEPLILHYLGQTHLLEHARVHPIQIMLASTMLAKSAYAQYYPSILTRLDDLFHASFQQVRSMQKRILVGMDVSASMDSSRCIGCPHISAREAACAFAMILKHTEPYAHFMAFTDTLIPFDIRTQDRLHEVIENAKRLPFGNTDCSLPIQYALDKKQEVDLFLVITDNETNCNKVPPKELLAKYRKEVFPHAKMVVLSTASTDVSIADPNASYMLDVAGFDPSVFQVIRQFVLS